MADTSDVVRKSPRRKQKSSSKPPNYYYMTESGETVLASTAGLNERDDNQLKIKATTKKRIFSSDDDSIEEHDDKENGHEDYSSYVDDGPNLDWHILPTKPDTDGDLNTDDSTNSTKRSTINILAEVHSASPPGYVSPKSLHSDMASPSSLKSPPPSPSKNGCVVSKADRIYYHKRPNPGSATRKSRRINRETFKKPADPPEQPSSSDQAGAATIVGSSVAQSPVSEPSVSSACRNITEDLNKCPSRNSNTDSDKSNGDKHYTKLKKQETNSEQSLTSNFEQDACILPDDGCHVIDGTNDVLSVASSETTVMMGDVQKDVERLKERNEEERMADFDEKESFNDGMETNQVRNTQHHEEVEEVEVISKVTKEPLDESDILDALMDSSFTSPRVSTSPKKSPRLSTSPKESPRLSTSPKKSPRVSTSPKKSPRLLTSPKKSPRVSMSPKKSSFKDGNLPKQMAFDSHHPSEIDAAVGGNPPMKTESRHRLNSSLNTSTEEFVSADEMIVDKDLPYFVDESHLLQHEDLTLNASPSSPRPCTPPSPQPSTQPSPPVKKENQSDEEKKSLAKSCKTPTPPRSRQVRCSKSDLDESFHTALSSDEEKEKIKTVEKKSKRRRSNKLLTQIKSEEDEMEIQKTKTVERKKTQRRKSVKLLSQIVDDDSDSDFPVPQKKSFTSQFHRFLQLTKDLDDTPSEKGTPTAGRGDMMQDSPATMLSKQLDEFTLDTPVAKLPFDEIKTEPPRQSRRTVRKVDRFSSPSPEKQASSIESKPTRLRTPQRASIKVKKEEPSPVTTPERKPKMFAVTPRKTVTPIKTPDRKPTITSFKTPDRKPIISAVSPRTPVVNLAKESDVNAIQNYLSPTKLKVNVSTPAKDLKLHCSPHRLLIDVSMHTNEVEKHTSPVRVKLTQPNLKSLADHCSPSKLTVQIRSPPAKVLAKMKNQDTVGEDNGDVLLLDDDEDVTKERKRARKDKPSARRRSTRLRQQEVVWETESAGSCNKESTDDGSNRALSGKETGSVQGSDVESLASLGSEFDDLDMFASAEPRKRTGRRQSLRIAKRQSLQLGKFDGRTRSVGLTEEEVRKLNKRNVPASTRKKKSRSARDDTSEASSVVSIASDSDIVFCGMFKSPEPSTASNASEKTSRRDEMEQNLWNDFDVEFDTVRKSKRARGRTAKSSRRMSARLCGGQSSFMELAVTGDAHEVTGHQDIDAGEVVPPKKSRRGRKQSDKSESVISEVPSINDVTDEVSSVKELDNIEAIIEMPQKKGRRGRKQSDRSESVASEVPSINDVTDEVSSVKELDTQDIDAIDMPQKKGRRGRKQSNKTESVTSEVPSINEVTDEVFSVKELENYESEDAEMSPKKGCHGRKQSDKSESVASEVPSISEVTDDIASVKELDNQDTEIIDSPPKKGRRGRKQSDKTESVVSEVPSISEVASVTELENYDMLENAGRKRNDSVGSESVKEIDIDIQDLPMVDVTKTVKGRKKVTAKLSRSRRRSSRSFKPVKREELLPEESDITDSQVNDEETFAETMISEDIQRPIDQEIGASFVDSVVNNERLVPIVDSNNVKVAEGLSTSDIDKMISDASRSCVEPADNTAVDEDALGILMEEGEDLETQESISKNKPDWLTQICDDSIKTEIIDDNDDDDDFEISSVSVPEKTAKPKRAVSRPRKKNAKSTQSVQDTVNEQSVIEGRKSRRISQNPKINYADLSDLALKVSMVAEKEQKHSTKSVPDKSKRRKSLPKVQPVVTEEKPKRNRKRKNSTVIADQEVEELYTSRGKTVSDPNVTPEDLLETIFESPVSKPTGTPILISKRRYHRRQTFPEKPWRPRPGKIKICGRKKKGNKGRFKKAAEIGEDVLTARLDEVLADLSELSPVAKSPKKVMTPFPRQHSMSRI